MASSPFIPWYYSAMSAHHGGTFPDAIFGLPTAPMTLPWEQSEGENTNIFPPYDSTAGTPPNTKSTQLNSYILGNYRGYNSYEDSLYSALLESSETDQTNTGNKDLLNFAPDKHGGALFNHFRDGSALSWSSSFVWTFNDSKPTYTETLDDSTDAFPAPTSTTGTAATGGGTNPTWTGPSALTESGSLGTIGTSFTADPAFAATSDVTGTAIDNGYLMAPVTHNKVATATVQWAFQVASTGVYSFFVNIPNRPDVISPGGETRINDAHYTVLINGVVATTAEISQTEANSPQFVAGPFRAASGDIVTLQLDNRTSEPGLPNRDLTASPQILGGVVVADTAILAISSGHDVRGGAAVINKTDYPEIANASYYGILAGTPGTGPDGLPHLKAAADPVPFGKYTTDIGTAGSITVAGTTSTTTPPRHDIRQLVYFGDSELVSAIGVHADGTTFTYQHFAGAMYCIDGLRGNVVWRYQCPDFFDTSGFAKDNGVFMTPVVSRINVRNPATGATDYNHPVVIFGDQSGKVYCLDAIGNGILRANNVSTGSATDVDAVTGNPIPNQVFTTIDSTGVANFSMPLDFDPALAAPGELPLWSGPPNGTLSRCTADPTNNLSIQGQTGCHSTNNFATTTPLKVQVSAGSNSFVSLIAGTTVYWVFRPDANHSTTGNQVLSYGSDDNTPPSFSFPPPANTYNVQFPIGVTTSGLDEDGTTAIAWNTAGTTATTAADSAGAEYSTVAAMNVTAANTLPAQAASIKYTMNMGAAGLNPTPPTALYDVLVSIPPNGPGETRTFAQYSVDINGAQALNKSISQDNQTGVVKIVKIGSLPLKPTDTAHLTIYNVSTSPATAGGSALTGETIIADAVFLAITTTVTTNPAKNVMPIPGAFNEASPAIYVEPGNMIVDTARTNFGPTNQAVKAGTTTVVNPNSPPPPDAPSTTDPTKAVGTAYLYVTNSNGTIYSIDPTGVPVTSANLYSSINIDPGVPNPTNWTPTANVRWWFSTRKDKQDETTGIHSHIDSAPSILVPDPANPKQHTIYFGTATESTNKNESEGHVYALDFTGPVDILTGKLLNPVDTNGRPTAADGAELDYNTVARPAWSFPDAYGKSDNNGNGIATWTVENNSATGAPALPLGDITGTPVPFYNPATGKTRIIVAADSGSEWEPGDVGVTTHAAGTFGRIWSIENYDYNLLTGNSHVQHVWAFPSANDPNDLIAAVSQEPQKAMGAFNHATPAIGFVQWPREIQYGAQDVNKVPQTVWSHQDRVVADIKNTVVPMLYVGCMGDFDRGFYALDLNGGDTAVDDSTDTGNNADISRFIYRMESPNGFSWNSSPVLLVNQQAHPNHTGFDSAVGNYPIEDGATTEDWGGGGALMATAGNTLYQISATFTSNLVDFENGPFISMDKRFQGFGPLCSPTMGACNISGLENGKDTKSINGIFATGDPNVIYADPDQVTEWVYCGDQSSGLIRGITPADQAFGGGDEIAAEMPTDIEPPNAVNARFPLHAYIGQVAKNSADMTPDLKINGGGPGGMLSMDGTDGSTFFDWGSSVYVRISNVVPPNPNDTDRTLRVPEPDPTNPILPAGTYMTNGSPVSYTITEVPANQVTSGSTFTDYQASGSVATLSALPGDGFIARVGVNGYAKADDGSATALAQTLVDNLGLGGAGGREWVYASTYFIGNGTGHSDTPGATRRIINATQTCQVYLGDPNSLTPGTPTSNTVTLTTELSQGTQFQQKDASGNVTGLGQTVPSPDPTFGIANPLSIIGAGVSVSNNLVPLGGMGYMRDQSGPVPGNYPTKLPDPSNVAGITNNGLDMQANGNFIYSGDATTNSLPKAGLLINYDPSKLNSDGTTATNSFTPDGRTGGVETNLGFVHDGRSGDNQIGNVAEPFAGTTRNDFHSVGMGVGDRSQVGLRGMSIRVNLKDVPSQWFDSSAAHGPGSRINSLPWEDTPTSFDYGANASSDYPDIGLNNLDVHLDTYGAPLGSGPRQGRSGSMIGGSVTLDPRDITVGGDPTVQADNNTYNDTVKTTVKVPRYQPANLEVETIASNNLATGYVQKQRMFVDTNNSGQWDEGEAYRDFDIKAGVPINAATHMADSTIDVGTVSGGFGVQMEPFLTSLDPFITAGNGNGSGTTTALNSPYLFSPYTPYYRSSFQPLAVYNDGNVNLLNLHLDQKLRTGLAPSPYSPLMMGSPVVDTGNPIPGSGIVDINAGIPALDVLGQTRPFSGTLPGSMTSVDNGSGTGTAAQPFLVRSSLDTDLVQAYGRNPQLFVNGDNSTTPQPWSSTYQGATFHKARPGSTAPSQLTVPDTSPYITDPRDRWYFPQSTDPPSLVSNGTTLLPSAAYPPYVSIAVPLGTPVGTYSEQIKVFDGTDRDFYAYRAPTYGDIALGWPFNVSPYPSFAYGVVDSLLFPQYDPSTGQPTSAGQLASDPTANLNVTVVEHRMTDAPPDYLDKNNKLSGYNWGVLKDIADSTNTTVKALPDFYPAAVRDLWWNGTTPNGTGSMAMLWSSGRNSTNSVNAYPGLSLTSAVLGTNAGTDTLGWFKSATPANPNVPGDYTWWSAIPDVFNGQSLPNSVTKGFNTGGAVAQDMPVYNPTADTFSSDGTSYAFWVNTDTQEGLDTNSGLSTIYCAPYNAANGLFGTVMPVTPPLPTASTTTSANEQPITGALRGASDVRGLKYNIGSWLNTIDPNTGNAITNNLWAFWTVGGHGQSAIYYESGVAGSTPTFSQIPLALPIPAGLSGVSDASATVIPAPDTTASPSGSATGANPAATLVGTELVPPTVPVIEVTYSGINETGSSDIYVSRFRPYLPNSGTSSGVQNVALWPVPYPITNEQLRPDPSGVWWKARDIGWVRNNRVNVYVNGASIFGGSTKATYDKASGLMVYTNVGVGSAVFIDMPHGRVRFSPALPATTHVNVWINPMSRIVSATKSQASSEPVAFVDAAFENNQAVSSGFDPTASRAQAARYWCIYRKSGSGAADQVGAKLWANTQRLGIPLYNNSGNTLHIATSTTTTVDIPPGGRVRIDPASLDPGASMTITVQDVSTGFPVQTLFPGAPASSSADIDWVHGYVYLPLLINEGTIGGGPNWVSPEGHKIQVTFSVRGAQPAAQITVTDFVHWIDEPRFNDGSNGNAIAVNDTSVAYVPGPFVSAIAPNAANDFALTQPEGTNESQPFAFIDPMTYADLYGGPLDPYGRATNATPPQPVTDQPHKIWLFWSSSRDAGKPAGTNTASPVASSDLFYEALAPAFGATP